MRLGEAAAFTDYDLALVAGTVTGMGILADFMSVTGMAITLAFSTPGLLMMKGVATAVRTLSDMDGMLSMAGRLLRIGA